MITAKIDRPIPLSVRAQNVFNRITSVLVISPLVALTLGIDNAHIIGQMDYWLQNPEAGYMINGEKWIYNGYSAWAEQLPWLSVHQVGRHIRQLEAQNLIISGNFNNTTRDRRKWYRLNYHAIALLTGWNPRKLKFKNHQQPQPESAPPDQNEDCTFQSANLHNAFCNPAESSISIAYPYPTTPSDECNANSFLTDNNDEPEVKLEDELYNDEEIDFLLSQELDCHEEPCSAPPKIRKPKKFNAKQSKVCAAFLLDEPVFVQWWVNRLLKTKFGTEELVLTPQAFVRSSIRKNAEQALDMWESFQSEMSHRMENYNTRVEHGCQISAQEQEQIQAIAPFATQIHSVAALPESRSEAPAQLAALPEQEAGVQGAGCKGERVSPGQNKKQGLQSPSVCPPAPPSPAPLPLPESQPQPPTQIEAPPEAENPDAYKLWQPPTIEVAPPPEGFFQQMMARLTGKMSMPKAPQVERKPVVSELERLNADILDPILRPEVLRRVMASDSYVVDFDEQGVPYQVRRV